MVNINPLLRYGQNTLTRYRQAENLISRYSDTINDGLGTTNDIVSNISNGRNLVQFIKHRTEVAPGFETNYQNMVDTILNEHLDKLELTQNLTEDEQGKFLKNIDGDRNTFVTFALDGKPSVVLCGQNTFLKPTDKYDIVKRELEIPLKSKSVKIDNTFILNKELVKQTIEENKDLFIIRMGLKPESDTDKIYEVFGRANQNSVGLCYFGGHIKRRQKNDR